MVQFVTETGEFAPKQFVNHRVIFCGNCKEETLWFVSVAFDVCNCNEAVLIGTCCECGETKKASVLNEYDRQMRYLHGGHNE